MTSFFDMPPPYAARLVQPAPRPPGLIRGSWRGSPQRATAGRLDFESRAHRPSPQEEQTMLVYFYDTLLAIMAVVIIWFAAYSVKKLYQGQR
jgi:hypothetical protein